MRVPPFRASLVRSILGAAAMLLGAAGPADAVWGQGRALPAASVSRPAPPPASAGQVAGGNGSRTASSGFTPRKLPANTPPSLRGTAASPQQAPPAGTANRQATRHHAANKSPNQGDGQAGRGGNAPGGSVPGEARLSGGKGQLPRGAGQEFRVYDLRPYTGYLTKQDAPHQAVVDWIIRETGTDVWHTEPFGFMSADRDELQVYHTPEMHQVIAGIVDRFVAGEKEPQVMNMRVMTVGNPNWRARAHMMMQHVHVESPGLQAWLLTKENAALVLNMLRSRTDVRQVQDVEMIMHNGQTKKIASTRGRNYVMNVKPSPAGWPPYEPEIGEVQEGYQLSVSPLLSLDGRTLDCVITAHIDQVDKLVDVDLNLPLPNRENYRTKIEVPQLVSWRLKERFRWPSDMVLLLSCGVVASPDRPQASLPMFDFSPITGTTAGRADALMFIQFGGRASDSLTSTPAVVPQISSRMTAPHRGRY